MTGHGELTATLALHAVRRSRLLRAGLGGLLIVVMLLLAELHEASAAEETTTTTIASPTSTTLPGDRPVQTVEVATQAGAIVALTCGVIVGGLLWRGRIG